MQEEFVSKTKRKQEMHALQALGVALVELPLSQLDALALPAPSLGIEQADAHNLRAQILQASDPRAAVTEYEEALHIFEKLGKDSTARHSTAFHQRYDDLLFGLVRLSQQRPDAGARALLKRAVTGYLELAQASIASGSAAYAKVALDNISRLLPELPEPDRMDLLKIYQVVADKISRK